MTRIAVLALVLLPLGCADASDVAHLELVERDQPEQGGLAVIPFGDELVELDEPAAAPPAGDRPHVVVGRWRGVAADGERSSAQCPFEVKAIGFPAISLDGATIVGAIRGTWSASDGEDEELTVRFYDVLRDAQTERETVFDGGEHEYDEDNARRCKPMWRAATERAAAINARLDAQPWRALVDVGIRGADADLDFSGELDEDAPVVPASERPVELVHVGTQAAFRIPGVRVLHRAEVRWNGTESWPCSVEPVVYSTLGDRETGTVAVFLDHQSGGCLCYPELELHALRVPDGLFEEAAGRAQPLRELPWPVATAIGRG